MLRYKSDKIFMGSACWKLPNAAERNQGKPESVERELRLWVRIVMCQFSTNWFVKLMQFKDFLVDIDVPILKFTQKSRGTRMGPFLQKKNVGRIIPPNFNLCCKALLNSRPWLWRRDRHTSQLNSRENPEIDPHKFFQSIFWELQRQFSGGRTVF